MDADQARIYHAALEYVDKGWSLIPIDRNTKRPLIKWKDRQYSKTTREDVENWAGVFLEWNIAILTGSISGIVVLDCDDDAAEKHCIDAGLDTPFSVRTIKGRHFYYAHPGPGFVVKNRASIGGKRLDLRGDGGYAVLPPSFYEKDNGRAFYQWLPFALDWDDMPEWKPGAEPVVDSNVVNMDGSAFDIDSLDLSQAVLSDYAIDELIAKCEATGEKIGEGRRNNTLARFAGARAAEGLRGDALVSVCEAMMSRVFAKPLEGEEVKRTVASVERTEAIRHPGGREAPPQSRGRIKTVTELLGHLQRLERPTYLMSPWLPEGGVVQVAGFSGHGKSLVMMAAMRSLSMGLPFGPFPVASAKSVLYIDYENARYVLQDRLETMSRMIGVPAGDDMFKMIATNIADDEVPQDLNILSQMGRKNIADLVRSECPDVLVIDTIRSAASGLQENLAEAWAPVNEFARKIRVWAQQVNKKPLTVVMLHHRNKPSEDGLGTEAGSTAQLNLLDTQLMITQVFDNGQVARERKGILDPDAWSDLSGRVGSGKLSSVFRLTYGKLRALIEGMDNEVTLGIGYERMPTGIPNNFLVWRPTNYEKVIGLAKLGEPPIEIARKIKVPLGVVEEWIECMHA